MGSNRRDDAPADSGPTRRLKNADDETDQGRVRFGFLSPKLVKGRHLFVAGPSGLPQSRYTRTMSARANDSGFTSVLVPDHDVLLVEADSTQLSQDLDLHILSCGLKYDPLVRQLLEDGLLALAFHILTRPGEETVGWTISLQKPALNLFFTGHAAEGYVAGRGFAGGVRRREQNLFLAQVSRPRNTPRLSTLSVEGLDIFAMVEAYYERSEQRPARFFHQNRRIIFGQPLPGADPAWLAALQSPTAFELAKADSSRVLCRRHVSFTCGCNTERILEVVSKVYGKDSSTLFGVDPAVHIECPRCAAGYRLPREEYEKYVARK